MSLLREIQTDLVDRNVAVSDILRKAKVLSARLGFTPFKEWVDHELGGYPPEIDVPDYRTWRVHCFGSFTDGFRLYNNMEIPRSCIPEPVAESMFRHPARVSIDEIERLANESQDHAFNFSPEVSAMMSGRVYQGMQCISSYQRLNRSLMTTTIAAVKNRLLDFVLELEVAHIDADTTPGFQPNSQEGNISNIYNTTISNSTANVTVGSSEIQQSLHQYQLEAKGDWNRLLEALRDAKVPEPDIEDVTHLLEEVKDETPTALPAQITNWLGQLLARAALGAAGGFSTGSGESVGKAIMGFLGIAP